MQHNNQSQILATCHAMIFSAVDIRRDTAPYSTKVSTTVKVTTISSRYSEWELTWHIWNYLRYYWLILSKIPFCISGLWCGAGAGRENTFQNCWLNLPLVRVGAGGGGCVKECCLLGGCGCGGVNIICCGSILRILNQSAVTSTASSLLLQACRWCLTVDSTIRGEDAN